MKQKKTHIIVGFLLCGLRKIHFSLFVNLKYASGVEE